MSAVLTRRRNPRGRSRDRDRDAGVQASLFGQVVAPPPVAPEPERAMPDRDASVAVPPAASPAPQRPGPRDATADAPTAPAGVITPAAPEPPVVAPAAPESRAVVGPTLDDTMSSLWRELLRPDAAACPVCSEPMQPRHSAGAGVVGGRCGGCGSTLA